MKWKASGPHAVQSDEGYKVARFRTGHTEQYRPSLRGSFIGGSYKTAEDAKRVCIDHHKEATCPAQS
jgi:hypothetical protein